MRFIKLFFLALLPLLIGGKASADGGKAYPVSDIPLELMGPNVRAVVRDYDRTFEVRREDKAYITVKYAVTIFNPKADHEAMIRVPYSKGLIKVSSFSASVFDKDGKFISAAKKSDILDLSAHDGYSLFSDNRIMKVDLVQPEYPYTVVYEYKLKDEALLFYPGWSAYQGLNTAVQRSSFKVIMPSELELYYREQNMPEPAKITEQDKETHYQWSIQNMPAPEPVPAAPSVRERFPRVDLRPSKFEFEGYSGSLDSWETMGKWQQSLMKGRSQLSEEQKAKVQELIADAEGEVEKVKRIYQYLQENTRYVSVQLGIGGWQPFPATYVGENGYGDCKALSNYTCALLEEAGVNAHYALVRAGRGEAPILSDFPSSQFNHVIVCAPTASDTVWLECTSQTNPFGYLGSFTGDRDVLLIKEEGSHLVRTPKYTADNNLQSRKATAKLSAEGHAAIEVEALYTGLQQERYERYLRESDKKRKEWLLKHFQLPQYELGEYSIERVEHAAGKFVPGLEVKASLLARSCASKSGKRLFIQPSLLTKSTYQPPQQDNRQDSLLISMSYYDTDTVQIQLPQNFYSEYLPEGIEIETPFGHYENSYRISEEGVLIYTRAVRMKEGRYAPEAYEEYVEFYKKMRRADKKKAVLVDKT